MYMKMADILQPMEIGNFKLDHFEIGEKPCLQALMDGIPTGKYARLYVNGEVAMSDTPMEKRSNTSFVCDAFGDVLIGGLGIGMILMAIQDKEKVKSIIVIEKHQEVIDLIGKQLPLNDKVKIIQGDIFEYKLERNTKFDIIYLDIWNWVNQDIWEREMKPLKAKYRRYLKPKSENPKRGVSCWAEYYAKTNRPLR